MESFSFSLSLCMTESIFRQSKSQEAVNEFEGCYSVFTRSLTLHTQHVNDNIVFLSYISSSCNHIIWEWRNIDYVLQTYKQHVESTVEGGEKMKAVKLKLGEGWRAALREEETEKMYIKFHLKYPIYQSECRKKGMKLSCTHDSAFH